MREHHSAGAPRVFFRPQGKSPERSWVTFSRPPAFAHLSDEEFSGLLEILPLTVDSSPFILNWSVFIADDPHYLCPRPRLRRSTGSPMILLIAPGRYMISSTYLISRPGMRCALDWRLTSDRRKTNEHES